MSDLRKAAEQALAILQDIHPGNMTPMAEDAWVRASQKLYAALAEPEQSEPVGYLNKHTGQFFNDVEGYKGSLLQPLFAHPPRREPLPREQVKQILREAEYDTATAQERADFINGIRHGEAAHGIGEKP